MFRTIIQLQNYNYSSHTLDGQDIQGKGKEYLVFEIPSSPMRTLFLTPKHKLQFPMSNQITLLMETFSPPNLE
jgi:serine protease inhibitor ecotin